MSRDVNGSGLTNAVGMVNGRTPLPSLVEAARSAVLDRRTPIESVRVKGGKVVITLDVTSALRSLEDRRRPRRPLRVLARPEEPFEIVERRLPAHRGAPRFW